jgi:hypothetical protein
MTWTEWLTFGAVATVMLSFAVVLWKITSH